MSKMNQTKPSSQVTTIAGQKVEVKIENGTPSVSILEEKTLFAKPIQLVVDGQLHDFVIRYDSASQTVDIEKIVYPIHRDWIRGGKTAKEIAKNQRQYLRTVNFHHTWMDAREKGASEGLVENLRNQATHMEEVTLKSLAGYWEDLLLEHVDFDEFIQFFSSNAFDFILSVIG